MADKDKKQATGIKRVITILNHSYSGGVDFRKIRLSRLYLG